MLGAIGISEIAGLGAVTEDGIPPATNGAAVAAAAIVAVADVSFAAGALLAIAKDSCETGVVTTGFPAATTDAAAAGGCAVRMDAGSFCMSGSAVDSFKEPADGCVAGIAPTGAAACDGMMADGTIAAESKLLADAADIVATPGPSFLASAPVAGCPDTTDIAGGKGIALAAVARGVLLKSTGDDAAGDGTFTEGAGTTADTNAGIG